jgi:hypothetical protein
VLPVDVETGASAEEQEQGRPVAGKTGIKERLLIGVQFRGRRGRGEQRLKRQSD